MGPVSRAKRNYDRNDESRKRFARKKFFANPAFARPRPGRGSAREEEIRLEKKRKGMPTVDPRASQNTISWFARKPAAKPEPVLEKLVEEPEDDDVALPELRGAEPRGRRRRLSRV
ncbi:unnamed protein product [Parascedosporium putredinis]|uniref:Uncharacterized protein n=1 Tax=Parascedosporium putredinis TaxID=1442378 RepID=A0A9P1HAK2_9PEZI|nr:unnamed protein product [Parascedosporium putredinis]CAI8002808.1 unnamed protein product [Parascedosporium putredinis]